MKTSVTEELFRLAELHSGLLQPEVVVEAARAPDSPLHGSFEWDDAVAGQQHRLHQARMLIAHVRYEPPMVDPPMQSANVRHFVSLTPDRVVGGAGYRVLATVMSDAALRAQLLVDAKADMRRFRERYRSLVELAGVFAAMAAVDPPVVAPAEPSTPIAEPTAAAS
jgi:hypothetical protein